jgi:hypothetical protein
MLIVFHEKVPGRFIKGIAFTHDGVLILPFLSELQAMWKLTDLPGGSGVIFNVFYVPPSFNYQCFQSILTKFFGGPSACNNRTHYNGIISVLLIVLGIDEDTFHTG